MASYSQKIESADSSGSTLTQNEFVDVSRVSVSPYIYFRFSCGVFPPLFLWCIPSVIPWYSLRYVLCLSQYLNGFVDDYPGPLFDQFSTHLSRCATAYHAELQREQRKMALTNLFVLCDNPGVSPYPT